MSKERQGYMIIFERYIVLSVILQFVFWRAFQIVL